MNYFILHLMLLNLNLVPRRLSILIIGKGAWVLEAVVQIRLINTLYIQEIIILIFYYAPLMLETRIRSIYNKKILQKFEKQALGMLI